MKRGVLQAGFVVVCLIVAGGPCLPDGSARKPRPARDTALLQRLFGEVCTTVEEVCGAPFEHRPTLVVCSVKDVRDVLRALDREPWAPRAAPAGAGAGPDPRFVPAWYDSVRHRVVVVSETLEECIDVPRTRAEDAIRVALAHEAGHAWGERYGIVAECLRRRGVGGEGSDAALAVSEGHAHHVAFRAAERWGIVPAFERLTAAIAPESPPRIEWNDWPMRDLLDIQGEFHLVVARRLVASVEAQDGPAGIERLLRDPPRRAVDIERPADWLAGRPAPKDDRLAAALGALRAVVPPEGYEVSAGEVSEWAIRRETSLWPADRALAVVGAYRGGRAVTARDPSRWGGRVDRREFFAAVLEFADDARAETFLRGWREALPLRPASVPDARFHAPREVEDWIPTPDMRGFRVTWRLDGHWPARALLARTGRHVLFAGIHSPDLPDWERQAKPLLAAAAALTAPTHGSAGSGGGR